jgi:DNA-binding IclR family transcriptional regulator
MSTLEHRSVVVLRDVTEDQAKQEILDYFHAHPDSYPSDVADALRLDVALVRDLCAGLVEEGLLDWRGRSRSCQ